MSCPTLISPACVVAGKVAGAVAGTVASGALNGIASAIQSGEMSVGHDISSHLPGRGGRRIR